MNRLVVKGRMKPYGSLIRSYGKAAGNYDHRWRRYNQGSLEVTFNAVAWNQVGSLLDVGCGTGLFEVMVRRHYADIRLTGVDVSQAMLQQGRKKMSGASQTNWANALAEALQFPAHSFDAVVCANSFHYIRQPDRALEEFRRVLRPGGCLVITDWCDDYLACKICDLVLRLFDPAHFRMYGTQECAERLDRAGFRIETSERFKIDWLWGLMTYRARA